MKLTEEELKKRKKTNSKILKIFGGIIAVFIIIGALGDDTPKSTKTVKKEKTESHKMKFAIPQVSAWDGVAMAVKDYVKGNFNDPDVEYIEASYILKLSNGLWLQRVKLRAVNGFGAKIIKNLGFVISGTGSDAKVLAFDDISAVSKEIDKNGVYVLSKYNSDGEVVK